MSGPLALIDHDPEGGYNVIDTRDGEPLAWRSELSSVNEIAVQLNSAYPPGAPAPAHDSLVHEIVMTRVGGEPETPLYIWASDEVNLCGLVPESIGGPLDFGLWRPAPREEA